ncbi:MAG TPA: MFS transporter [Acidimicrobiales bacterium]|nr:MFS transporter [Acidimicrobiales bacterium]
MGTRQTTRETDDAVEAVESARAELQVKGRAAVGVTGDSEAPPLRRALAESGVGWYPMVSLGLLLTVDQFQSNSVVVLGPEITASLGMPRSALAGIVLVKTLVLTLATLPVASLVQRHPRRAAICIVTAFAWSVMTLGTGFVVTLWGLFLVMVLDGASSASVQAVHEPLLLDSYPPPIRVRVMAFYRGAQAAGQVAAPLLIGLCTAILGWTWRGVFVAQGVVCILVALFATRLRDPGFGRFDTERVRDVVRGKGAARAEVDDSQVKLGFFEIAQRVLLIPTVRKILVANAVLGMLIVPFVTYLAFFLQEEWGMGPGSRSVFSAATSLCGVVALAAFGKRDEMLFRQDPGRLVRLAGTLLGIGITTLAVAIFTPVFAVMVVLFAVALAMTSVILPILHMAMFSVVPAHMRPHLAALAGIALAGVGGTMGILLLSGVDRRYGSAGAILSLAVPGIAAGLVLHRAARTVNDDLDRMVGEIIEEEEIRALVQSGTTLPMLACRHIDFAYDQVQVLFDVSFTVDEGEMVALLGTNGAGKSTLLRVISGLGLPSRGSVRYLGADITFLDPQRRVSLGLKQIAGGRATFPGLTVVENLRAAGYSLGRDRKAIDAGIDVVFEAFPRLAERRNQPAAQMSGGENQMIALGKAFMVRPRLLLIDELSLGLAPKVVGELLEMVRQINAQGTAIVLVEQSVNIALSLVDHAYFMEKGSVRFDGDAKELLGRDDLLRSVFLQGASAGLPS